MKHTVKSSFVLCIKLGCMNLFIAIVRIPYYEFVIYFVSVDFNQPWENVEKTLLQRWNLVVTLITKSQLALNIGSSKFKNHIEIVKYWRLHFLNLNLVYWTQLSMKLLFRDTFVTRNVCIKMVDCSIYNIRNSKKKSWTVVYNIV